MELIFKSIKISNLSTLNLNLESNQIIGIVGEDRISVIELFKKLDYISGSITINGNKVYKKDISDILKKISLTDDKFYGMGTVESELLYFIKMLGYKIKEPRKKIIASLKLLGLDISYLERSIETLSTSETKLISLARSLMGDFDILVVNDVLEFLDRKTRLKVMRFLNRLKEEKDILLIISSCDSNVVYQYANKILVFEDNKLVEDGSDVADIELFTNKANAKGANIDYHKDIRDLIKDIYKHV